MPVGKGPGVPKPFNDGHSAPMKNPNGQHIPIMNEHLKERMQNPNGNSSANYLTSPKEVIMRNQEQIFTRGSPALKQAGANIEKSASVAHLPMHDQQQALYGNHSPSHRQIGATP